MLLRHALPEKDREFLIDQVDDLLDRISADVFVRAVEIMYSGKIKNKNPLELLLLFVQGLKKNNFFEYVSFIRNLKSHA